MAPRLIKGVQGSLGSHVRPTLNLHPPWLRRRKVVSLNERGATAYPEYLQSAHDLCLVNHDVLVELLRRGEEGSSFAEKFTFRNKADQEAFAEAEDVLEWLGKTRSASERAVFLRRIIFPAVLSDFLHFVYEALETSRKGKLNVSFALIRKPLQDALFVFELMAVDLEGFAAKLATNPEVLDSKKAGGIDAHTERIASVLRCIKEEARFDAGYLARLRYEKKTHDGFDSGANKALHLFTNHEAIRTEPMNINFIFSGLDEKLTQWYFLYSRLPYLLFYARRLVEHLFGTFEPRTDPAYLSDIERRVEAGTLLWARKVDPSYQNPYITKFVERTRERLEGELAGIGCPTPTTSELIRIRDSGVIRTGARRVLSRWRRNLSSVVRRGG